jgi:hypothetical protein
MRIETNLEVKPLITDSAPKGNYKQNGFERSWEKLTELSFLAPKSDVKRP